METALTPLGAEMVGELGVEAQIAFGELTLIATRANILSVLTALKDRFGFHQLLDLCGVDFPDRAERFEVVYHLLSMTRNARVRVKLTTDEVQPVPSAVGVFPMTGYVEVRYDEEQKRVIYEPVKLTQEFRNFDFLSPWEGAEYATTVLPGDEKAQGLAGSKA
ncbi:NADH-quinone oxidoreductase subunit C [Brevundimonas sp. Root1423]|uniref:complex I 30 kDa subunit family protein n=1 Tax=Brevundimonas sp. Root1423 TaxID=1736462 RepID=UPI0009EB1221